MNCECGGILMVIRIEEPPEDLPKHKKLTYDRVCDLECISCSKQYYSRPYDFGMKNLNAVKGNMKDI